MTPSHSMPRGRARTSTLAPIAVRATSRPSTVPSRALLTRTTPDAQSATPPAISRLLGFTRLATKKTMGVNANARPVTASHGTRASRKDDSADANSAPHKAALHSRMR